MSTFQFLSHDDNSTQCGSPLCEVHISFEIAEWEDHMVSDDEQSIDLEEVTITTAPQMSWLHVFTNLARAIHTRVSYMWGSFRCIITPICNCLLREIQQTPPTPQETIRGQLNKGWVPLSEHLSQDYDEVLMQDHLHCLETTIAHALVVHSTTLPNCIPLLQEVEHDIRT